MHEWIRQTLTAKEFGLAVLPAAFVFGIFGSITSCCTLPVLGAVAGYAGGLGEKRERRDVLLVGLFFTIGTVLSLAALGAVAGFVGQAAGASLGKYWKLAAGLAMVVFGLASMEFIRLPLPRWGTGANPGRSGIAGALTYGLALGGGTTACSFSCNPLLPMAMGAAVMRGTTLLGAGMLGAFALGYSLPLAGGLVGIGLGVGHIGSWLRRSMTAVRIGGGILLIVVGFYLLAGA